MTTYVAFAPSTTSAPPFSFQATLGGAAYTVSASWNFATQRWYLGLTDQFGNVVLNVPMVGSPAQIPLEALSWASGFATAIAPSYLGYRVGSSVAFSVAGASPAALNGMFQCTIVGPTTFAYAVPDDPGMVSAFGSFSADTNLISGYISGSTLVWRPSTGNFEIGP